MPTVLFSCCLVAAALVQDPGADPRLKSAGEQAQRAVEATQKGDWKALIDLTHPKLVEMGGGREKMLELLKTQMEQLKKDGFDLKEATIDAPTTIAEGESAVYCIVPTHNVIEIPQGTLTIDSYLIGASIDGGTKWTFIDSSPGTDQIRTIFPELPETLILPERGQPKFEPKAAGN